MWSFSFLLPAVEEFQFESSFLSLCVYVSHKHTLSEVALLVFFSTLSLFECRIATSVWCLLSFDVYLYHTQTLAFFHGELSEPRSTYLDLPDRKWKFMSYALKSPNAQLLSYQEKNCEVK